MKNIEIKTVEEMLTFLKGNQRVDFEMVTREEKYSFIRNTLLGAKYRKLRKKDRGVVKIFLVKVTGYEDRHIKRLAKEWQEFGLRYTKRESVGASVCVYKQADIVTTHQDRYSTPNTKWTDHESNTHA